MAQISNKFISRSYSDIVRRGNKIPAIERFLVCPAEIRNKILDLADLKGSTNLALSCRAAAERVGLNYVYPRRAKESPIPSNFPYFMSHYEYQWLLHPLARVCLRGSPQFFDWVFSHSMNRLSPSDFQLVVGEGTQEQICRAISVIAPIDENMPPGTQFYLNSIYMILQSKATTSKTLSTMLHNKIILQEIGKNLREFSKYLVRSYRYNVLEFVYKKLLNIPESEFFYLYQYLFEKFDSSHLASLKDGKVPRVPSNVVPYIFAMTLANVYLPTADIMDYLVSQYGYPAQITDNLSIWIIPDIANRFGYFINERTNCWERNCWLSKKKLLQ
jgi:hypothetical protein